MGSGGDGSRGGRDLILELGIGNLELANWSVAPLQPGRFCGIEKKQRRVSGWAAVVRCLGETTVTRLFGQGYWAGRA
jgi:hypothetical protein